jgi:hypothetical protein
MGNCMGGVKSALGFGGLPPEVAHGNFFELSASDPTGKTVDFNVFRGNVCLVVNVASK